MTNTLGGDLPLVDPTASIQAAEIFHGLREPQDGEIPPIMSDAYVAERAEISSNLIALATPLVVIKDDSPLGYRFSEPIPDGVDTIDALQDWVQVLCHSALDTLVQDDERVGALAQRYQDLVVPTKPLGQEQSPEGRRSAIEFSGAVLEPYAILKLASVVAKYFNQSISPDQALAYVISKLPNMKRSANMDVAPQRIRGAIFDAAIALGAFNSPDSKDKEMRYMLLKQYVLQQTKHELAGKKFGSLYRVRPDSETGVTLEENPAGFGRINPVRQRPSGCPAAYRLTDPRRMIPNGNSALFMLLRAGISAFNDPRIVADALKVEPVHVPAALKVLEAKLIKEGKLAVASTSTSIWRLRA